MSEAPASRALPFCLLLSVEPRSVGAGAHFVIHSLADRHNARLTFGSRILIGSLVGHFCPIRANIRVAIIARFQEKLFRLLYKKL